MYKDWFARFRHDRSLPPAPCAAALCGDPEFFAHQGKYACRDLLYQFGVDHAALALVFALTATAVYPGVNLVYPYGHDADLRLPLSCLRPGGLVLAGVDAVQLLYPPQTLAVSHR
jgi:hypothetical protein